MRDKRGFTLIIDYDESGCDRKIIHRGMTSEEILGHLRMIEEEILCDAVITRRDNAKCQANAERSDSKE